MQVGTQLQQEIIASLSIRLEKEQSFNPSVLADVVKDAIEEVIEVRNYPSTYTQEQISEDLSKYKSKIKKIALYDYNKNGVEGQTSHSENSISRDYEDRNSYFSRILPLSRL